MASGYYIGLLLPEIAEQVAKEMLYRKPLYPMTFPKRCHVVHETVFLQRRELCRIVQGTRRKGR